MGLAYRFGSAGYEKDPAKAMQIWNEGVPDSRCLFELGKCYFWGEVVPEDHALAYDYMKKSRTMTRTSRMITFLLTRNLSAQKLRLRHL